MISYSFTLSIRFAFLILILSGYAITAHAQADATSFGETATCRPTRWGGSICEYKNHFIPNNPRITSLFGIYTTRNGGCWGVNSVELQCTCASGSSGVKISEWYEGADLYKAYSCRSD